MKKTPVATILKMLVALAAVAACDGGDRVTSPLGNANYVLEQVGGAALPVPLDDDTITGTTHYVLVADTLHFDAHAKLITGKTVIREEIVNSRAAPLVATGQYAETVDVSGNEGTVTGVCVPPGAPCAPLTLSVTVSGDLLILDGGVPPTSKTYRRIRN
jgi:hypothetical protein